MDLVITNARLLDSEGLWQVGIDSGFISKVARSVDSNPDPKIDARGGLVLPSFIEPHVHLDKVLLAEQFKEATSISEARQSVRNAKKSFTLDNVKERIEKVLPWAIESGVTIVRTHIDVDEYAKLTSVGAVLEIKKKYADLVDIQIVAFPQEGLLKDSQAPELIRKAIELGCKVVGGLPETELSNEDSKKHIDIAMSLAIEKNLDLDLHCDVLPSGKSIEYYAAEVAKRGLQGRASADHLIALSYYDDNYASKIIGMIRAASMNVITNPCTMISSGTKDPPPKGRGITRVKELIAAGVNVAFGTDNLMDPYNPMGDFNPLSNGWLLAYGAQLGQSSELLSLIRMPTFNSSAILRLEKYGIREGCTADLNVFQETSVRELLRKHGRPRYVLKRGRILVENRSETVRNF